MKNSNRYNQSRAVYRGVQERHEDIEYIEWNIAELCYSTTSFPLSALSDWLLESTV